MERFRPDFALTHFPGFLLSPFADLLILATFKFSNTTQGWHTFKTLLQYKLEELGGELVLVDAKYTSQRCSDCGHTNSDNRTTQARFCCTHCGHAENADHNAARNILAAGHAVLACGDTKLIAA